MTNVPSPAWGPEGFVAPDEPAILDGVIADFNEAFGGGLNPALDTPQGQLASSLAAIVGSANDTFVKYTNQVDPAAADGRMQDAIARIYFIERMASRPTVVTATCIGLPGVVIPVNSLAQASDGNQYICMQEGTIPVAGFVDLEFNCLVPGPIACPAGALNTIYRAIPGWDSISNAVAGVPGIDVETRADFERRRAQSVAKNSLGMLSSIRGAVLDVPGVLDALVLENSANLSTVVGGKRLAGNSLYVAVVGGDVDAVARAIWTKKSPGCAYNGNTTRVVYDDNSGYSPPYPAYSVTFELPAELAVIAAVEIAEGPLVPADAAEQIQAAIVAAFAGEDGGPRARIGGEVFASRYYAPVAALGWTEIIAIKLGSAETSLATFVASMAGAVLTVASMSAGVGLLAPGHTVVAAGVSPGTKITAFLSGSGSIGTYSINLPQTIPSRTMRAVLPDQDVVTVNIDQVPVVSAADVAVAVTPL